MTNRRILEEKLNPPALDIEDGLEDEEIFHKAMSGVQPIVKGRRSSPRPRQGGRCPQGERSPSRPEQPLIDFMQDAEPIESHHHPGYVEGGLLRWDRRLIRKLRRGGFSVQEDLDLHGFTQQEARREMELFLREASLRGHTCVRVVHGKGLNSPNHESVLKRKVPEWLMQKRFSRYVLAFASAPVRDGGSGATYVLLRNNLVRTRPENAQKRTKKHGSGAR